MKVIKFKGKRIDNGEWVYGSLVNLSPRGQYIVVFDMVTDKEETYPVWSETVGQYIGLKDKNGVEIYKGDIVNDGVSSGVVGWHDELASFAVYVPNDGSYWFNKGQNIKPDATTQLKDTEIVGNIHEEN